MSAPLTPPPPPHERSSRDVGRPPSDGQAAATTPHADEEGPAAGQPRHGWWYEQDGPGMKAEIREAAVTAVAVALGGVLLGVLWWWLAPRVPYVGDVVGDGWVVYLKDAEGEQSVGVDGTFALLALGFGAVSALAVFLVRRRGGVPLVVALAVGGLLGSVLAWRLGVWLGPSSDLIARARSAGDGVAFDAPLKLGAKGALLAWPFAALVLHLGLTGLFGPRDPEQSPPAEPSGAQPGA
ncbi:AAA family ATPase [Streptomyces sp. YIM B13518]|uniref:AAA family ATPase n=1 Tax=Streptomyces sp. YIM B13518 TaxID=3366316 RepID=UPI0036BD0EF7